MENSLNQNKVWGWGELALLYFPNISQKSATMQLLKWIRVSDELVGQLEKRAGIRARNTSPPDRRITSWATSENRSSLQFSIVCCQFLKQATELPLPPPEVAISNAIC